MGFWGRFERFERAASTYFRGAITPDYRHTPRSFLVGDPHTSGDLRTARTWSRDSVTEAQSEGEAAFPPVL